MGNRCFRPPSNKNQPLYKICIDRSYQEALGMVQGKAPQSTDPQSQTNRSADHYSQLAIEIKLNENKKGSLKKLFEHFTSHEGNISPALDYCNKKTILERNLAIVVVSVVFTQKLVKFLLNKKEKVLKQWESQNKNINQSTDSNLRVSQTHALYPPSISASLQKSSKLGTELVNFKNFIHNVEGNFFPLVYTIITWDDRNSDSLMKLQASSSQQTEKPKKVKRRLSSVQQTMLRAIIEYCQEFNDQIRNVAKQEIRNILELLLLLNVEVPGKKSSIKNETLLFNCDISHLLSVLLDQKDSHLIYEAYGSLLKALRVDLMGYHAIEIHFSHLLELWFRIHQQSAQVSKAKTKTHGDSVNTQNGELVNCLEMALGQYFLMVQEDKNIKNVILRSIVFRLDAQKYSASERLEVIVRDSLSEYYLESFMFSWLEFLTSYIENNERDGLKIKAMMGLDQNLSNCLSPQNKIQSIKMLTRWIGSGQLNPKKTIENFSIKIFRGLVHNFESTPEINSESISAETKTCLQEVLRVEQNKILEFAAVLFDFVSSPEREKAQKLRQNNNDKSRAQNDPLYLRSLRLLRVLHRPQSLSCSFSSAEFMMNPISSSSDSNRNIEYLLISTLAFDAMQHSDEKTTKSYVIFFNSFVNTKKVTEQLVENSLQKVHSSDLSKVCQLLTSRDKKLVSTLQNYIQKNIVQSSEQTKVYSILFAILIMLNMAQHYIEGNRKKSADLEQLLQSLYKMVGDPSKEDEIYELYHKNSKHVCKKFKETELIEIDPSYHENLPMLRRTSRNNTTEEVLSASVVSTSKLEKSEIHDKDLQSVIQRLRK